MVDQQRIAQPIGDRVFLGIAFNDESVITVEVESMDDGQLLIAIAEEHLYAVGILALRLQQVAVSQRFLERRQHDIVRIIVHIVYLRDAINMQGITPDGVLTHIGFDVWLIRVVRIGYHLTLLRELIVSVSILQGIDAVFAFSNTPDNKMSVAIRARHTQQWLGAEGRVGQVIIQTYEDA